MAKDVSQPSFLNFTLCQLFFFFFFWENFACVCVCVLVCVRERVCVCALWALLDLFAQHNHISFKRQGV